MALFEHFPTSVGFEVEFTNKPSLTSQKMFDRLKQQSVEQGLNVECNNHWHRSTQADIWAVKTDSSCGFEATSPVIRRLSELDEQLKFVDIMAGYDRLEINKKCGLHVHVGVPANQSAADVLTNLLRFFYRYEEAFMQVVPKHRVDNVYCKRIKPSEIQSYKRVLTRYEDSHFMAPVDLLNKLGHEWNDKNQWVNLRPLKRTRTFELRLFHSTFDRATIRNTVLFFMHAFQTVQLGTKYKWGKANAASLDNLFRSMLSAGGFYNPSDDNDADRAAVCRKWALKAVRTHKGHAVSSSTERPTREEQPIFEELRRYANSNFSERWVEAATGSLEDCNFEDYGEHTPNELRQLDLAHRAETERREAMFQLAEGILNSCTVDMSSAADIAEAIRDLENASETIHNTYHPSEAMVAVSAIQSRITAYNRAIRDLEEADDNSGFEDDAEDDVPDPYPAPSDLTPRLQRMAFNQAIKALKRIRQLIGEVYDINSFEAALHGLNLITLRKVNQKIRSLILKVVNSRASQPYKTEVIHHLTQALDIVQSRIEDDERSDSGTFANDITIETSWTPFAGTTGTHTMSDSTGSIHYYTYTSAGSI